jgi:hypothetical protein
MPGGGGRAAGTGGGGEMGGRDPGGGLARAGGGELKGGGLVKKGGGELPATERAIGIVGGVLRGTLTDPVGWDRCPGTYQNVPSKADRPCGVGQMPRYHQRTIKS